MAHEIGHVYVFEFNLNMIFILQDFCLNWRNKSVNNNLSKCNLCYIVLFRLGCYHDEDSHCSEYPKFDGPTIIVIGIGQLVHSIISVIFWSKILLKLTFAINIFFVCFVLFFSSYGEIFQMSHFLIGAIALNVYWNKTYRICYRHFKSTENCLQFIDNVNNGWKENLIQSQS